MFLDPRCIHLVVFENSTDVIFFFRFQRILSSFYLCGFPTHPQKCCSIKALKCLKTFSDRERPISLSVMLCQSSVSLLSFYCEAMEDGA